MMKPILSTCKSWYVLTTVCFVTAAIFCIKASSNGREIKRAEKQKAQERVIHEQEQEKKNAERAVKAREERINLLNSAGGLNWVDLRQTDLNLLNDDHVHTLMVQLTSQLREMTRGKYVEVLSMTKPRFISGHWNVVVTLNEPTYSIKKCDESWTKILNECNAWEVCEECSAGTKLTLEFTPRQSATFRNSKNEVTFSRSQLMRRMRGTHSGRYYKKGSEVERDLPKLASVLKDLNDSIKRDEAVRLADPVARENLQLNRERSEHLMKTYRNWSYDGDVVEMLPESLKEMTHGLASWTPPPSRRSRIRPSTRR